MNDYLHLNNDDFFKTYYEYLETKNNIDSDKLNSEIKELEQLIEKKKEVIDLKFTLCFRIRTMLDLIDVYPPTKLGQHIKNLKLFNPENTERILFLENLLKEYEKYNIDIEDVKNKSGLVF